MNRLKAQKIDIFTSTQIKAIRPQGAVVVTRNGGEETWEGFDAIVLAAGVKPRNEVASQIEGRAKEVYVIGDAATAGRGLEAIRDGAEIGRKI